MAWADHLTDSSVHAYFYLRVEGCATIFTSQALPAGWYTGGRLKAVALDVSGGIEPPAQALARKSGGAAPTAMTFRIGPDDVSGTLRRLFATRLATGWTTTLKETIGWADGPGTLIDVSSSAGAPAPPFDVQIGRECVGIDQVNVGPPATVRIAARGKHLSVPWKFPFLPNSPQGSRLLRTYIGQWEGRRVFLWKGWANALGQPLDTAFGGPDQRQIWRGRITSCLPDDTWGFWRLTCESIDAELDVEVGQLQAQGRLAWTTNAYYPDKSLDWGQVMCAGYVLAGQNTGTVLVQAPASATWVPVPFTVPAGQYGDLMAEIRKAMIAALRAAYGAYTWDDYMVYQFDPWGEAYSEGAPPETKHLALVVHVNNPGFILQLQVNPNSVLQQGGFSVGIHEEAEISTDNYHVFYQDLPPPICFVSAGASQLLVLEEQNPLGSPWPATGYARIHDPTADRHEVIQWTSLTEIVVGPPRVLRLNGVIRGRCGTMPITIWIPGVFDDGQPGQAGAASEQAAIKCGIGAHDERWLTTVLRLALGTGGGVPRHAVYDTAAIPEFVAAGLDADDFDLDRWNGASTGLPGWLSFRHLFFSKPLNLRKWLMAELATCGYMLMSRSTAGGYRISLERVGQPLLIPQATLTAADLVIGEWPDLKSSLADLFTAVACKLNWDVGKEKWIGEPIAVHAVDAQLDTGIRASLELEARGIQNGVSIPPRTDLAIYLAAHVFDHYAKRYEVVTLQCRRPAWVFRPGTNVAVTLAGIPNPDGTAGWTAEPCLVLAAAPCYLKGGREAACTLTLLHLPPRRLSYYAPCARVAALGPGANEVTLDANAYSQSYQENPITGASSAADVQWFHVNDHVWLRRPGEEATFQIDRQISAILGNVVTFTAAPAGVAVGDVLTLPSWAAAIAAQQLYVYCADNSDTIGAGNVAPFQWSA